MKNLIKNTTTFAMLLFIILLALRGLDVVAQKSPPEFSIYANGGISTYCFQPTTKGVSFKGYSTDNQPGFKVNSSIGFSSDLGIGFTGFFSQQVGIHTGAGFGLLNVKSRLNLYNITPDLDDNYSGKKYDLHTMLINYTEIHKIMFVTIPVMLQFQTKQKQYWDWTKTKRVGFYALGGLKVHFLFNNRYESGVDSLYNAAYFTEWKNWAGTQKFVGFGSFNGSSSVGKLDFGVLVSLALEAGVKWRIDKNIFVYTGAFFDCGLYDPFKKDSRQDYKKFIQQEDLKDLPLLRFSDRVNLMVVGIKVRFAFSKQQSPY